MKSSPEKVMGHTEGKLVAKGNVIEHEDGGNVCYIANGGYYEDRYIARRFVTCWNEHDGLVHDNAQLYQSLQGEMKGRLKAETERDELVKALRDLYMHGLSDRVSTILSRYPDIK